MFGRCAILRLYVWRSGRFAKGNTVSFLLKLPLLAAGLGLIGFLSAAFAPAHADEFNVRRCVNMGNALDAPTEGEWGHTIDLDSFARIRAAGFDTVRIPVRWSAHVNIADDIDRKFIARVDEVINAALAQQLNIVLNVHHFEALMINPRGHSERLVHIWKQLAYYYQDLPASVSFELINEPNGALEGVRMRQLQADLITTIRETNPTRTLILGGEDWSNITTLNTNFISPDRNIVYTFHYYDPFDFTHQKAPWTGPNGPKETREWGTSRERQQVREDMRKARQFSLQTGRGIFLGEFGAYELAPEGSRREYMRAVSAEAQAAGIGWCVWNFASSFPLFDNGTKQWVPGQLEALGLRAN